MTDDQKIHPVAVEIQSPSAPLVPQHSQRSEKGDPAGTVQYPAFQRTIPITYSKPPKRRSCCCKFVCWTISLFILLLVLVGATAGILYLVFRPKLPDYSVDQLLISDFRINPSNNTLNAQFNVGITAKNPNKRIGIYYEDGSHLSVWYENTSLCAGTWSEFYQGHRNTTVLELVLSGENQFGSGLQATLLEQQQTGRIPLLFTGKVPVKIKLGRLKLRKVKFLVNCKLVVDSLTVNNQISIKTSSCKFKLRL